MDHQKPTYLVDWYAVLAIANDADAETIKAACRRLSGLYHPDKYAHLAPEFAAQAERRQRLINEGQAILSDPDKRTAYDAQLASWDGPVSRDGNPILIIGCEPMTPLRFLQGPTNGLLERKMESLALQVSGYNEQMFAFLEKSVGDDTKPEQVAPDLRAAYTAALRAKDLYLGMSEEGLARSMGLDLGGDNGFLPGTFEHLSEVMDKLVTYRANFDDSLSQQLLGLSAGGVKLQLTVGGEMVEASPDVLAKLRERAMVRFADLSQKLEELATERKSVIEERLAFLEMEYVPENQRKQPKLIVAIHADKGRFVSFCVRLEGGQIVVVDLPQDQLDEYMRTPARALTDGWSLARVEVIDHIDPRELLHEVVNRHFGPMIGPDTQP